ncbi:MAG: hypothetical protein JW855_03235 [Gammaproteobacteria bacterium]|nr:hypothetical protein [Gammaproteobacteria bacterium]
MVKKKVYHERRILIDQFYEKDDAWKNIIDKTIESFFIRFQKKNKDISYSKNKVLEKCLAYLKEEMVVITLWPKFYRYVIYPAPRPLASEKSYQYFRKINHPYHSDRLVLKFIN